MRTLFFLFVTMPVLAFWLMSVPVTKPLSKSLPKALTPSAKPVVVISPPLDNSSIIKEWARAMNLPGLPNLHKVSHQLYRGAQPTAEGMEQLKSLGVKTIVNLRSFHSDRKKIGDTGLAYEHIYMKHWHPEDKELVRFLQIVSDESRQPVFVHCMEGSDRTGLMCALYRIVQEGWSTDEAVKEMRKGGFGFNSVWSNLETYLRDLDIDNIRERAGLDK